MDTGVVQNGGALRHPQEAGALLKGLGAQLGHLQDLPAGGEGRFPQLKEINGLFAFLLHFADKTVVDFNLLGAGVAFVFYGFMDDNLLDQGIQQFGSQF